MRHRIRRGGIVLAVGAAVALAPVLAACGSSARTPGAAGSVSATTSAQAASPTATAAATPDATASSAGANSLADPGAMPKPVPAGSVQAQLTAAPAGAKLVPVEQWGRSADGRTLYLEIEARGGACGMYDMVLQESASEVRVGLANLPARVGVMCPNTVRLEAFPAKLAAPLGNRTVIDLATGQPVGPIGVIPLPLPAIP